MKMISRNCLECNKEFKALIKEVNRGNGKFCTRNCSLEYLKFLRKERIIKNKIPNCSCALCKKDFYRTISKLNSKSALYFCSRNCKNIAQRLGGIKEIQPDHYGTSIGKDTYRSRAVAFYKKECNRCKWNTIPNILIVHHKNRDRNNNELDNLEVLCPNCHMAEHYLAKDGPFKFRK